MQYDYLCFIYRRILIDTGDEDVPQYINHLKAVLHYEGIDLAHIFITHRHHDHIGGLKDIFEEIKEKISMYILCIYFYLS